MWRPGWNSPPTTASLFSSWFESKFDERPDSYGYAASERLERMIEKAIADGWFRQCDPVVAALSVWAGAHGLTMLAVTIPDFPGAKDKCAGLTLDDLIAFHAEATGRGLATPKLNAWLDAQK